MNLFCIRHWGVCSWPSLSYSFHWSQKSRDSVSVLVAKSEFRSGFRWCQNQTPMTKETKPTPTVSNKQNVVIFQEFCHSCLSDSCICCFSISLSSDPNFGGKKSFTLWTYIKHTVFEIGSIQCLTIPLPSSRAWPRLFFHFTNERICCFNAGLGSTHANSFLFVSFSTPTLLVTLAFL